ncbi:zinc finger protein ZAT3-like [Solanum dulcamara]|uniref:zinc finger protein ZAT3-like n=1 Tax=Solanum dulcamara TaxID=45834 RepID=UPI002485EA05|nr:zinc finger protein ZAT3-like [Solanum dulcamara]
MENHPSTSNSHPHHHHQHCQSLPFSNNFLLDRHEEQEEKPTLPIFDSSIVPSVDNLHNNPKRKRSRFLKIGDGSNSLNITSLKKPKITKKPPDPSAPKITRPCTECGKKFWSWKALFGHMRCHPERQWRGINPPPNFRPRHDNNNNNNIIDSPNSVEFSPRKNPKLVSDAIMTDEDHEIAACLLQLANGLSKPDSDIVDNAELPDHENVRIVASEDQPCSSSGGGGGVKDFRFECSGCKKVFGSHQALGGHRASHKNVKGCFASGSGTSGLTQAVVSTNLDLNFPPPVTLISGEDQYDSSSSYSSIYSGSTLDLRLKL